MAVSDAGLDQIDGECETGKNRDAPKDRGELIDEKACCKVILSIATFGTIPAELTNISSTKEGIQMLKFEVREFTRMLEETISLGDPLSPDAVIEVQIIEIRGDQVRLGITAPRAIPVHRTEIWEQVQQVGRKLEERAFD